MHNSYQSQLRRCSSVNDQDSFELKTDYDQHTSNLILQRKVSVHDDDSSTKENERHSEHTFTAKLDHNENKPVTQSFCPISDEDFLECEIKEELTFSSYVHDHEICRVIKNLTLSLFETYHPDMLTNVKLEKNEEVIQNKQNHIHKLYYNHTQRQGKMLAQHANEYCEACRIGLCFT
ncbi:unnamed protein product [Rotaria socialis]|uniref:Uncharacterized protein n=1 Tax=Rotaria socialis TaxID=392032 RepID=A0A820M0J2_9BILA|nr:unnamed protein product [Rotaria socialis]